ncbi:MAG: hypothetical protein ABFD94_07885 [Armatimonadia bacterium]
MKVPRAEPTESPSFGIPTPDANSRSALGMGTTLERTAEWHLRKQEDLEERILHAKRQVDAAAILSEFSGVLATEGEQVDPDTPPAEQAARFSAAGQQWLDTRATQITDPLLQASVMVAGTHALAQGTDAYRAKATRRMLEVTQLRTKEQIANLVSQGRFEDARGMIEAQTRAGVFSGEQGAAETEGARTGSINSVVAQLQEQGDDVALEAVQARSGLFAHLKPEEHRKLVDNLTNRIQASIKQVEETAALTQKAAADELKGLEASIKAVHGRNEVELIGRFLDDPSTDPKLAVQAARAGLIAGSRESVMGLVNALNEIKTRANNEDDPNVVTDVDFRLYQPSGPAITARQLLAHRQARRISDTTFRRGMNVLQDYAKFATTEGGKERVSSYAAAKEAVETFFTTVGEVYSGDKKDITILRGQALQNLYRMTKGGRSDGVDPIEALPIVMQQYRSVGVDVVKTYLRQIPPAYLKQGVPDGVKLQQDHFNGTITDDEYRRYRNYILWSSDIVPPQEWGAILNPPVLPPAPATATPAAKPTTPAPAGGRKAKE